jgi:hypothetical protein
MLRSDILFPVREKSSGLIASASSSTPFDDDILMATFMSELRHYTAGSSPPITMPTMSEVMGGIVFAVQATCGC